MKKLSDTQKEKIREMRAVGFGYKAIAGKLSISRETVRSFCVRNNVPKSVDVTEQVTQPKAERHKNETKFGNTVFIISTEYSKTATEPLLKKLERLILNAAAKQSGSIIFQCICAILYKNTTVCFLRCAG